MNTCEEFSAMRGEDKSPNLPGGGTYYALAMILGFNRVEFEVDVLREIPHERKNFAHALIHDA